MLKKTIFERGNCPTGRGNSIEWVHVQNRFSRGLILLPPLIGGNVSQQIGMFRWLFRKGYNLLSFNYSGHGNSEDKFSLGATLRDTRRMLHYYRRILHPESRMKKSFAAAAKSYLDFLFPDIRKGKTYFGILERRRIDLLKTLADIITLDPLQYVTLRKTSVLCLYASNDKILKIYDKGIKTNYRNDVRKVCPRTLFASLDGDHFLSPSKNKENAVKQIKDFLQEGP